MSRRQFDVTELLRSVRTEAKLPALGCAIIRLSGREPEVWVDGFRTGSTGAKVAPSDTWHLGSDTKAMTAALLAFYVHEGKLKYTDIVASVIRMKGESPEYEKLTVSDLLKMQANLSHDPKKDWDDYQKIDAPMIQIRQTVAHDELTRPGVAGLTVPFNYSNTAYLIAGHIAESITGNLYESEMKRRIFEPLKLNSAAFGPNPKDEPQPHIDGVPVKDADPDNPPVMAPAGRARMSLHDWAIFCGEVMKSVRGEPSLLAPEYGDRLKAADTKSVYIDGWGKVIQPWSNGYIYTHSGSNTMNYCTAWLAPKEGVAYLAVTNDGGKTASKATNDVIKALVKNRVD